MGADDQRQIHWNSSRPPELLRHLSISLLLLSTHVNANKAFINILVNGVVSAFTISFQHHALLLFSWASTFHHSVILSRVGVVARSQEAGPIHLKTQWHRTPPGPCRGSEEAATLKPVRLHITSDEWPG
jgi:hypothetical protein